MYCLATTDGQTDDSIMPTADHTSQLVKCELQSKSNPETTTRKRPLIILPSVVVRDKTLGL